MTFTLKERRTQLFLTIAISSILIYGFYSLAEVRLASFIFAAMLLFAFLVFADFFPDKRLDTNPLILIGVFIAGFLYINSLDPAIKSYSGFTLFALFGWIAFQGILRGKR